MTIIPYSHTFDHSTLRKMLEHDPLVQRTHAFLAQFRWTVVPDPPIEASQPGKRPHPQSAYIKALLLKIDADFASCTQLRRFLLEHPLLVLELGFRPVLDVRAPYGFDVQRTVPTARWLGEQQRTLSQSVLQPLLMATAEDLCAEIPGLGETVAFDVTHLYAFVKERFKKEQQPRGDPDCKLGVKRSTNKEQPDGSTTEEKEYLWGYGSGVASATIPGYGDVVVAEYTLPFNENDITYFVPLYLRTVATLGFFPTHITAEPLSMPGTPIRWSSIAVASPPFLSTSTAIPRASATAMGCPCVPMGCVCTPPTSSPTPTATCRNAFAVPLLFPQASGQTCDHPQFLKEKGCVKDLNWELGGQMRVTLDRQSPLYKGIYHQRTSTERINSQSKELGIKRPKVRTLPAVRNLNTLTYLVINARALQRAWQINACLLTTQLGKIA